MDHKRAVVNGASSARICKLNIVPRSQSKLLKDGFLNGLEEAGESPDGQLAVQGVRPALLEVSRWYLWHNICVSIRYLSRPYRPPGSPLRLLRVRPCCGLDSRKHSPLHRPGARCSFFYVLLHCADAQLRCFKRRSSAGQNQKPPRAAPARRFAAAWCATRTSSATTSPPARRWESRF